MLSTSTTQAEAPTVGLRWSLVACSMTHAGPRRMTFRHDGLVRSVGRLRELYGTRRTDSVDNTRFFNQLGPEARRRFSVFFQEIFSVVEQPRVDE